MGLQLEPWLLLLLVDSSRGKEGPSSFLLGPLGWDAHLMSSVADLIDVFCCFFSGTRLVGTEPALVK